ncbi:dermonecrotic toxin domain-containing protein [Pseudomonas rhodesiae]|uniref:dermonecrotic toxin domain-containing protein n=1 Tax=Pseudomonas rhodesiae TaxID=76760 RepID=UPI0032B1B90A
MTSLNDDPTALPAEADDPARAAHEARQALRTQLTQRINSSPHPSRLINQLAVADLRCADAAKRLSGLIARAPKVLRVIRAALREAFDLDPDTLLFTEPLPPATARKVDRLTDRALQLLVLPSVPLNVNQFTALNLKDEPTHRLPFTALEALQRVIALKLFERLNTAQNAYWQTLATGSWQTREERWVELHRQMFADQALVARQLDELSSAGAAMVQALVDAPTAEARQRAGEQWASVQACKLMWPGVGPRLMPVPGALHLYRQGDPQGMPHVMYLPGLDRPFYEYPSFAQLQCGLVALIRSAVFDDLWQCLPLRRRHELCQPVTAAVTVRGSALHGDALALSALAIRDGQWENELACAVSINLTQVFSTAQQPAVTDKARYLAYIERGRRRSIGKARLGPIRRELLDWDQQRRHHEINFASTAPGLALNTVQQQVKRYEKGLTALLDPHDPGQDTPAWQESVTLESQLNDHAGTLRALLQDAQLKLFDVAFWIARPDGTSRRVARVIVAWRELLRSEARLQHRLRLLRTAHRDLLLEVLDTPLARHREGSQTRVLSVLVGGQPLHSLFVVTQAAALDDPQRRAPVLLCALGQEGGVASFARLDALTEGIKASLACRDVSLLWRYVDRQHHGTVRGLVTAQTLAVRYAPIDGNPLSLALKRLLKGYMRLQGRIKDRTAVFSEVSDAHLTRLLLAHELEQQLTAPAGEARVQARVHVDLVRQATGSQRTLPAWLDQASATHLDRFKRLQGHYLSSTFALQARLEQRLPDLPSFARRVLIARLREDGLYPSVDIDTPFIEMPDHVEGRFCSADATCSVGDRKEILTPSTGRTQFNLLQLALDNLDPQMLPTWWRFRYAQYLKPEWKGRLSPAYLIAMVSSLDIGGQYEALINGVFYPRDEAPRRLTEGRVPTLLRRALVTGADAHLYSAIQQGLTPSGQRLFSLAMAARTPSDLRKQGYHLQLYVVHLVGHTLLHDRYIAGIVVIHDLLSQGCVVYWPAAPDGNAISEHHSLQLAREYLNRIGAVPANTNALARHIAPGWAFEASAHSPEQACAQPPQFQVVYLLPEYVMLQGFWRGVEFVRSFSVKHQVPTALASQAEAQTLEQIASDPLNWLALVPTSYCDAQALLYQARVLELHRQAQANSQSGKTLERYRTQRLEAEKDSRVRALLSLFVPWFGLVNQLYELLLAARRYHHSGDPRDAVDVAFGTVFLLVDLILSVVPGPKARKGVRLRPMGVGLNRLHRTTLARSGRVPRLGRSSSPAGQLKLLERFKKPGVPADAVPLSGPGEKGLYVKHGEPFMVVGEDRYPVYRRGDEQFLRLKNQDAPGQDELILTIHAPGEWLLGADAPVAGPSSGMLSPWRSDTPVAWSPPARGATETAVRQSPGPQVAWRDWHANIVAQLPEAPSGHGVFLVPMQPEVALPHPPFRSVSSSPSLQERNYYVVRIDGHYYRLLPQGSNAPLDQIIFLTKDNPLFYRAVDNIERWLNSQLHEQPIPATLNAEKRWQLHRPLFDHPLEQSVAQVFPGMSLASRRLAGQRLIELADTGRTASATHLLNVRATLDGWIAAGGQTDDLFKLLRPAEPSGKHAFFIGFEGKAPGFSRVDFQPPTAPVPSLKAPVLKSLGALQKKQAKDALYLERGQAQQAAIKQLLEAQGFELRSLTKTHGGREHFVWVCTHGSSDNVYYVSTQWLESGSVASVPRPSKAQMEKHLALHPASEVHRLVNDAMGSERLVTMVGGIQWPVKGNLPPTVYFIKPQLTNP